MRRDAVALRAEAEQLRQSPFNTLSFHTVSGRALDRWHLPAPTGDYATDYLAGNQLAVELIAAAQRADLLGLTGQAGGMILQVLARLTDHDMRHGFADILGHAVTVGLEAVGLLPGLQRDLASAIERNRGMFATH